MPSRAANLTTPPAAARRVSVFGRPVAWSGFIAIAAAATGLAGLADHPIAEASAAFGDTVRSAARVLALGGDARVQAITLGVALLWGWRQRSPLRGLAFVAASVALAALLEEGTHLLLSRPRPTVFLATGVDELRLLGLRIFGKWGSFPSGHAARAFALVAGLWLVGEGRPWLRPLLAVAATAALARVALQHHFLSDVVAGAFLGVAAPSLLAALAAPWLRSPAPGATRDA